MSSISSCNLSGTDNRGLQPFSEKIVAETAMLLHCANRVQHFDNQIEALCESIATRLVPLARSPSVLAAICLEPGLALDHGVAHILLRDIGYPDLAVDNLLAKSLESGTNLGPERLPYRCLEQDWLRHIWRGGYLGGKSKPLRLTESMLGRRLDALCSTRLDIYAFTHTVMYASNLGTRQITLPRPKTEIAKDATAALAYSLDGTDYDLTAEILLTWPMLGLKWNAAAIFGLQLLLDVENEFGFLPGSSFNFSRYEALKEEEQSEYLLITCYHTVYVMGFLCATTLMPSRALPISVPLSHCSRGAGADILSLLVTERPAPRWMRLLEKLHPNQQDSLAPLLLAILLRYARTKGDLKLIQKALATAIQHELTDGTAPVQAAALLRRSELLSAILPIPHKPKAENNI